MAIVKRKPHIKFSALAMQKMKSFCMAGYKKRSEVSMLGVTADDATLEMLNTGSLNPADFYVLDFFPVKQECNSVYTEMFPEAIIDKRSELKEAGHPYECQNVHFHTHPNMGTTPSGTDEKNIEGYDPDVALITIIMNEDFVTKGSRKGINVRLDIWYPFRQTFKDGEVDFSVAEVNLLPANWGEDAYKENVVPKKLPVKKIKQTWGGKKDGFTFPYPNTQKQHSTNTKWANVGFDPDMYMDFDPVEVHTQTGITREMFGGDDPELKQRMLRNKPAKTYSHPELQFAYDNYVIDIDDADELEKLYLTDPEFGEKELLKELEEIEEDMWGI